MTRLLDATIIGVEKAGTTSLLRYLSAHEHIASHKSREMPFFVDEQMFRKGWESAYRRFFGEGEEGKLLLAKNVGCIFWEYGPQRLFDHNPDMKVIAVLRNPINRAYSAYRYSRQMGRENLETFEEAIKAEPDRLRRGSDLDVRYHAYLRRGLYTEQLRRVRSVFPEDQIKVVVFEELVQDPQAAVDGLFDFLNLPRSKVDVSRRHNEPTGLQEGMPLWARTANSGMLKFVSNLFPVSLRKKVKHLLSASDSRELDVKPMTSQTRAALKEFFAPEISDLEEMLGRDLNAWKQDG
jgi:hypothetical protein